MQVREGLKAKTEYSFSMMGIQAPCSRSHENPCIPKLAAV